MSQNIETNNSKDNSQESQEIRKIQENKLTQEQTNKQKQEEKIIKQIQTELEANVKKQKRLPKDIENILNKKVFTNIIIAISIMLYLFFVNIGSLNIETTIFIKDIKVFSIMLITLTIILFEYSYKKESGKICINGIETLVLAITSLILPYIYAIKNEKFNLIVASISFLFGAYYVGKAIIIYKKERKKYLKQENDINKILEK